MLQVPGKLYVWGQNDFGQLGLGQQGEDVEEKVQPFPLRIGSDLKVCCVSEYRRQKYSVDCSFTRMPGSITWIGTDEVSGVIKKQHDAPLKLC